MGPDPNLTDVTQHFSNYDEAVGIAARTFAAFKASRATGQVMWIPADRDRGHISAESLSRFIPLNNLTLVPALKQQDALWTAEQTLRSGAVNLIILELLDVYTLTESRRLKLAVEAGTSNLLVILPQAGTQTNSAAGTRWNVSPHNIDDTHPDMSKPLALTYYQKWQLIKNRAGALKSWVIQIETKSANMIQALPKIKQN